MSDEQRSPVTTAADLATLDEAEIIEGYNDGREGFPCSGNRSRSYWHGWKNGMVDSYRADPTPESRALIRDVLEAGRSPR